MGRPALGKEARSHTVTVRLNDAERDAMLVLGGNSALRGIRSLIERHLTPHAFEATVGASVVGMSEEEMAAALDLDRLSQAMPVADHDRVVPVEDLGPLADPRPMAGTVTSVAVVVPLDVITPPPHRHRRGARIRIDHEQGNPVTVFACAVVGCEKELA